MQASHLQHHPKAPKAQGNDKSQGTRVSASQQCLLDRSGTTTMPSQQYGCLHEICIEITAVDKPTWMGGGFPKSPPLDGELEGTNGREDGVESISSRDEPPARLPNPKWSALNLYT